MLIKLCSDVITSYRKILSISLLVLLSISGIGAQESENFDEFETFDDEDMQDEYAISSSDIIRIENILVSINGTLYENPSAQTVPVGKIPDFSILYGTIDLRRGQVYVKRRLDRKIPFWILRLNESPYYGNANIEIISTNSTFQENNIYAINLVISLTPDYRYTYFGGNAYAGFGIKHRNGFQSTFYAGGNRVEYTIENSTMVFDNSEKDYSSLTLVSGGRVFGYWNYLPSWSSVFIYGGDAYIGIKPLTSITLTLGGGVFGYSNVFDNFSDDKNKYIGMPNNKHTSLSAQFQSNIKLRVPFNRVEWYTSEVSVSFPVMFGLWNRDIHEMLDPYFSMGLFSKGRLAFKLGIPQALTLKTSYVNSILIFDTAPFQAKANILNGFYNSYGLSTQYGRRGAGYSEKLYVGNHGGSLNMEYGAIFFSRRSFALEGYAFYDTGFVSNKYEDSLGNIRHTVGPGFSFFAGNPVNMIFKLSLNIGGSVLNVQEDGDLIGVNFAAEFN